MLTPALDLPPSRNLMPLNTKIRCPACGAMIRVKPEHAHKRGRCPGCKQPFTVELPAAVETAAPIATIVDAPAREPQAPQDSPQPLPVLATPTPNTPVHDTPANEAPELATKEMATLLNLPKVGADTVLLPAPGLPTAASEIILGRGAGSTSAVTQEHPPGEVGEPPLAGGLSVGKLGRFDLRELLGQGAFGRVYLAFDSQLDRLVALKVPTFDASDVRKVQRFVAEAKAAAQLRHPNIVPTYESGVINGQYYIVSQYIAGQTLDKRLKENPPNVQQAASWVQQIADGLAYAHGQGIAHRDIKPANIMLDEHDVPQIMDFGLAKRLNDDAGMTIDGTVLGTPAYMSPEQARGDTANVGAASDQYSLGVVLYELLTGERPFNGPASVVIASVLHEDSPTPRDRRKSVPRDLDAICQMAMRKPAERRYATMQDFAQDLTNWLQEAPIKARVISLKERFARWLKKEPRVAGLAVAVVLLLILGVGISTSLALRASYHGKQAEDRARELEAAWGSLATARERVKEESQRAAEKERIAADLEASVQTLQQAASKAQAEAAAASRLESEKTEELKSLNGELERKQTELTVRQDELIDARKNLEEATKSAEQAKRELQMIEARMAALPVERIFIDHLATRMESEPLGKFYAYDTTILLPNGGKKYQVTVQSPEANDLLTEIADAHIVGVSNGRLVARTRDSIVVFDGQTSIRFAGTETILEELNYPLGFDFDGGAPNQYRLAAIGARVFGAPRQLELFMHSVELRDIKVTRQRDLSALVQGKYDRNGKLGWVKTDFENAQLIFQDQNGKAFHYIRGTSATPRNVLDDVAFEQADYRKETFVTANKNQLRVYDSSRLTAEFQAPGPINRVVISPRSSHLAATWGRNHFGIWDLRAANREPLLIYQSSFEIQDVEFVGDKIYCCGNREIAVWNLPGQDRIKLAPLSEPAAGRPGGGDPLPNMKLPRPGAPGLPRESAFPPQQIKPSGD